MSELVCALSGEEPDAEDLVADEGDDFDGMPEGWTKITFERRYTNPRLAEIRQAKRMLVNAALSQMPEDARGDMAPFVTIQIDAQFAALESSTSEYVVERESVYVSNPFDNRLVAEEYNNLRTTLGLEAVNPDEEND
jgi:hypothetical protein